MLRDGALRRGAYKDEVGATGKNPAKVSRLDSPRRLDTLRQPTMFVSTLFVQALLATAALALPSSKERFDKRVAMRNGGLRQGVPRNNLVSNVTETEYSSNSASTLRILRHSSR